MFDFLKNWKIFKKIFGYEEPVRPVFKPYLPTWDSRAAYATQWYDAQLQFKVDRRRCLHGDTLIPLLSGEAIPIKTLAEYDPKKEYWVYALDTEKMRIVPAIAFNARKTAVGEKMVEIILDDGSSFRCTLDHKIMLRDGSFKRADELKVGDSLMPLYRKYRRMGSTNKSIYELCYQPKTNRYEFTHRFVARDVGKYPKQNNVIHHKDFNSLNNAPENLEVLGVEQHSKLHEIYSGNLTKKDEKWREKILPSKVLVEYNKSNKHKEMLKQKWLDPEYREKMSKLLSEAKKLWWSKIPKEERIKRATFASLCRKQVVNHTVKEIRFLDGEFDGYDLSVKTYHNFAILTNLETKSGVIVSNSYEDVQEMDAFDIINSALDLYAEETVQYDIEKNASVWVESPNAKIKEIIEDLFKRLKLESQLFSIARNIAKYGDDFEQLAYNNEKGIIAIRHIPPDRVTRIEDLYGRLVGFAPGIIDIPDPNNLPKEMAKPYDFVHFRRLSSRRDSVHGDSILLGARRVWRQLKIVEDHLILYRILRAPDRWVYGIEVGNMPPEEKFRTIEEFKNRIRQQQYFPNPTLGELRGEYQPITLSDDFFYAMQDGKPEVKLDKFSGKGVVQDLGDVEYFRNKLFAALRIPKGYLGFEGDINARATLIQQDIRFARLIRSLRQAIITGLTEMCYIHLALLNIDPLLRENEFKIQMSPISYMDELQRADLYRMKLDIATLLARLGKDLNLDDKKWTTHILRKYMGFTDKEIKELIKRIERPPISTPMPAPTPTPMPTPTAPTPEATPEELPPVERIEGDKEFTPKEAKEFDEVFESDNGKRVEKIKSMFKEATYHRPSPEITITEEERKQLTPTLCFKRISEIREMIEKKVSEKNGGK